MKRLLPLLIILLASAAGYSQQKTIAITLDDLPAAGSKKSVQEIKELNARLIAHFVNLQTPVTGFVNEKKLYQKGEIDERADILRMWASTEGIELGNHTFSHPAMSATKLDDFKAEVLKGEIITRQVLKEHEKALSYFRFPFNDAGADTTSKRAFEVFLADHGYTIAPMTIQSSDYMYNALYERAKEAHDTLRMREIATAFMELTDSLFGFFEQEALETVGRPIAHIYLGHVNELHADVMPALVALMKARGYTIVPLSEAMKDEVYRQEDPYVKKWGISWLHRWNTKDRMKWLRAEPEPQPEIVEAYGAL